ncbi:MAG: PrsW family glutamic-type intramembrane protease [Planctomycetota bacterium]
MSATNEPQYLLLWKGIQSGPFTLALIREKLGACEISRMHQVNQNGRWIVLDEFLEKQGGDLDARRRAEAEKREKQMRHEFESQLAAERARKSALEEQLAKAENRTSLKHLLPAESLPPPPVPGNQPRTAGTASHKHSADQQPPFAGTDPIGEFNSNEFFSDVLKKRSDDELESLFITGTRLTTPALSQIDARWPKPWAFFKAVIASLVVFAGFVYGLVHFQNLYLLPGLIFVGSFSIPLSTLILFVELNVPRNVSLYQVFKLLFFGGIGSLLITLFLYTTFHAESSWGSAIAAGAVEETGKLGAVLLLMRNSRFHWTLNGLLIGAAVGTSFAAFESAGYALNALARDVVNSFNGAETNNMLWTIGLRALLTPASHIAWTGLATAALWQIKKQRKFEWEMLLEPRFLGTFGMVIGLHILWDAPIGISLIGSTMGIYAKMIGLGIIAWAAVLSYVQVGLKEIRNAQAMLGAQPRAYHPSVAVSEIPTQNA